MKKLMLIAGILSAVIAVFFLAAALLNLLGYYNVHDGPPELYNRLLQRTTVCFIAGAVLALVCAACFLIRAKL